MTARILGLVQLLLVATAMMIGVQAWSSFQAPQQEVPVAEADRPSRSRRSPAPRRPSHRDYRAVVNRDLFRTKTKPTPKAAPVNVEQLARTGMDLKLWGTIAGGTDAARAVIETPRFKAQHLYRTGDAVEEATVKQILRQKVVLTVNGKDEVLMMEEPTARGSAPARRAKRPAGGQARARVRRNVQQPDRHEPPEPQETPAAAEAGQVVNLTREMLSPVAVLLESEADLLFNSVEDDASGDEGLRVTAGKRGPVLRQLGLRNGDVIVDVDGEPAISGDDLAALFKEMPEGEEMVITVRRGRQTRTLRYHLP